MLLSLIFIIQMNSFVFFTSKPYIYAASKWICVSMCICGYNIASHSRVMFCLYAIFIRNISHSLVPRKCNILEIRVELHILFFKKNTETHTHIFIELCCFDYTFYFSSIHSFFYNNFHVSLSHFSQKKTIKIRSHECTHELF